MSTSSPYRKLDELIKQTDLWRWRPAHWGKPKYLSGHSTRLLITGEQFFPALIEAIHAAQNEIILETYIFAADATGEAVTQALIQAAQRKVAVYMVLDGFGAEHYPPAWVNELQTAGAQLEWYRPPRRGLHFRRSHLRRLHRKVTTIDGALAFVGGINILSDWDTGAQAPRLDYCVQLQGPLLASIRASQVSLWRRMRWAQFKSSDLQNTSLTLNETETPLSTLAFVARDNFRNRHAIESLYLQAIKTAQKSIIIANAYFLPGWRFRHALVKAQQRGVKIDILVPGQSDHYWAQAASRYLYQDFLQKGIAIHEYLPAQLHAKVMVCDAKWATVGSSNIDPLSLLLAREANIAIQDPSLAQQLQNHLIKAISTQSQSMNPDKLPYSLWQRCLNSLGFMLIRFALRLLVSQKSRHYWEES